MTAIPAVQWVKKAGMGKRNAADSPSLEHFLSGQDNEIGTTMYPAQLHGTAQMRALTSDQSAPVSVLIIIWCNADEQGSSPTYDNKPHNHSLTECSSLHKVVLNQA